jgi:DNA-binding response OmpR family regulator
MIDSFDTRRYMRSIFAPFVTVLEARDGMEALEVCSKKRPDLIISDVMMPNLDGFGLLEALKKSKELRTIPIIMLTARGGDEAKVDGLMAGADDYLAKPFNARELIARAHMQLQLGKRRQALESAFDARTAELRALSECEFNLMILM